MYGFMLGHLQVPYGHIYMITCLAIGVCVEPLEAKKKNWQTF